MHPLPAILGGPAIRSEGPPAWPIQDGEIQGVLIEVYQDGSWGKYFGDHGTTLTQFLCEYHETNYAVTCGSGTYAVELALRALKVEAGDEVLLAGYDFPGNFHGVHAVGAQPILVDIDPNNWNLDLHRVAEAISNKTKAVVASHLHGGIIPMRELMTIAEHHGLAVIEDAAQCPGAVVQGNKAGTWGHVGILSFGGSKLLSAGRGGALLTNDAAIHQRMQLVINRGNLVCPLSELQAAVLLPQLRKLDKRNSRRGRNVATLLDLLSDIPGLKPFINRVENSSPAYYKLGFQYRTEEFGLSRELLAGALRAEGIAVNKGFRALHVGRSPKRFRAGSALDESERAHHGTLILHHPILLGSQEDLLQIAEAFHKIHEHADAFND